MGDRDEDRDGPEERWAERLRVNYLDALARVRRQRDTLLLAVLDLENRVTALEVRLKNLGVKAIGVVNVAQSPLDLVIAERVVEANAEPVPPFPPPEPLRAMRCRWCGTETEEADGACSDVCRQELLNYERLADPRINQRPALTDPARDPSGDDRPRESGPADDPGTAGPRTRRDG